MKKGVVSSIFAVLVGVSMALSVSASDKEMNKSYKVGDEVSAFTLKDADGQEHNLSDQLGKKIIVLEFWNMNCPVSQAYVDRMKELHSRFAKEQGSEIVFYAIDSNEPNDVKGIQAFAKEKGMVYPVLKDEGNVIADKFGAQRTPEIYVIGKDKTIHYHGAVDNSQDAAQVKNHYLADTLTALKDGKEVPQKETKAFGCGIKRAEKS